LQKLRTPVAVFVANLQVLRYQAASTALESVNRHAERVLALHRLGLVPESAAEHGVFLEQAR